MLFLVITNTIMYQYCLYTLGIYYQYFLFKFFRLLFFSVHEHNKKSLFKTNQQFNAKKICLFQDIHTMDSYTFKDVERNAILHWYCRAGCNLNTCKKSNITRHILTNHQSSDLKYLGVEIVGWKYEQNHKESIEYLKKIKKEANVGDMDNCKNDIMLSIKYHALQRFRIRKGQNKLNEEEASVDKAKEIDATAKNEDNVRKCATKNSELPLPLFVLYSCDDLQIGWENSHYEWLPGSGLNNVGNTCYLNSVIKALFHVSSFASWLISDHDHRKTCEKSAKQDICIIYI